MLITTYLALRPCLNRVQDNYVHGIENAVELYKEAFHRGGFEVALMRDRTGRWPDYVSFLPCVPVMGGIAVYHSVRSVELFLLLLVHHHNCPCYGYVLLQAISTDSNRHPIKIKTTRQSK